MTAEGTRASKQLCQMFKQIRQGEIVNGRRLTQEATAEHLGVQAGQDPEDRGWHLSPATPGLLLMIYDARRFNLRSGTTGPHPAFGWRILLSPRGLSTPRVVHDTEVIGDLTSWRMNKMGSALAFLATADGPRSLAEGWAGTTCVRRRERRQGDVSRVRPGARPDRGCTATRAATTCLPRSTRSPHSSPDPGALAAYVPLDTGTRYVRLMESALGPRQRPGIRPSTRRWPISGGCESGHGWYSTGTRPARGDASEFASGDVRRQRKVAMS